MIIATTSYGTELFTWDDGSGPLWLYLESLGPVGIVRARTWEEAYECVEDEIMADADPEDPDTYARSYDETAEEGELAEGCHYRNNGIPANPHLSSPIAAEDLNGSALLKVTKKLLEEHGIRVRIS